MRKLLALLAPLTLTACIDGTASYLVEGNDHALSLRVRQDAFWNDGVSVTLVVSRLPECQRQLPLTDVSAAELAVDVYANGERNWIVKEGEQAWQVETETCALVTDKAGTPSGPKLGSFKLVEKKLVFEATPQPKAPAAPAAPAPAAEPAADAAAAAPAASQ
ncbi:hypothetical protein [Massilia sp. TS11]|uniref:hypothetical protein n=1 Tax=Massilia sp. TS11 TaxID=2908003 RepID=UPI001EDA0AA1|nr:hypothetical protein [Massilia sp. TS11]MCG2586630.1 hypothetical protein [Massilia sp. TS11]